MSTVPASENQDPAVSPDETASNPKTPPSAPPQETGGEVTTVALVADSEAPPEAETPAAPSLDRHECRACGYVYEPTDGDGRRNIAAGTLFEDVPATWVCPVCRAPKVQFINIGPKSKPSGFDENLTYGLGVNTMTAAQKRLLIFGSLVVGFLFLMSFYGFK
ncbi:MAG: rubredoxin [Prochlorothrix sp.]|nr:rubredoxin [Prochlorothrix sp.]